ncbi:MAG: hypothetical protein RR141_03235 [Rikenellaceae bacterium]
MKKIIFLTLVLLSSLSLSAQDTTNVAESKVINKVSNVLNSINGLKISGYIQAQWQLAEGEGQPGATQGSTFPLKSNNIFSIRRARVKFDYTYGIAKGVFQVDVTEKGVKLKDAYVALQSKNKIVGATAGVFDRPFGYEISYSSSLRETPERSRFYQILMPDERDMGVKTTFQGKEKTFLGNFNLNAGVFSGNAVNAETDSRKDIIAHIAYKNSNKNITYGAGASLYIGGVLNTQNIGYDFDKKTKKFIEKNDVIDQYSKRNYYGFDAQFSAKTTYGLTTLRAEYVWGQQPGRQLYSDSPKSLTTEPIYNRRFSGYSIYLIQQVMQYPVSVVLRLDSFDPNSQIKGNDIGVRNSNTGAGDITFTTLATGLVYQINKAFKLMACYETVWNETSSNLYSTEKYKNFASQIADNLLTIRAQVKF